MNVEIKKCLRFMESRFRQWLLGQHPYNTIWNYNWLNVRPMIRTFRDLGGIFRGRVVDVGSGPSPYYNLIAPRITSYIAVDYPSALPNKDSRPIYRVGGCIEAIPLLSNSVDVVFCTQVLSQVERPLDALTEIKRVLRRGGYAVISAPHVAPVYAQPCDFYRFTPDGLSCLANRAGLKTESIHVQGQLFSSFALSLAINLVLSPLGVEQALRRGRQIFFAPLIGLVNGAAYLLDLILPFTRTPVNFILVATKV